LDEWCLEMTDKKNLPSKNQQKVTPALHDNGLRTESIVEQSLKNLTAEQRQSLVGKASEEALRLEVKSREQEMDYTIGRKTAEDHVETFQMLEKGGRFVRQTVKSDIKTGAGKMEIESKSGATCFVATAVYGDHNHPDVIFLRVFRDDILSRYILGRSFIKWYWICGPRLAYIVRTNRIFMMTSKVLLSYFVRFLRRRYD
jgi:hypothetical protein